MSLIKGNDKQISDQLSKLFNQSIKQEIFQQPLKRATVILIYKNKDDFSNYRHISLLSTFSEIFEKNTEKYLINLLENKSIISPEKFGFRQNASIFHDLNNICESIYSTLHFRNSLLGIFIGFCQAFGIVRLDRLLQKLKH